MDQLELERLRVILVSYISEKLAEEFITPPEVRVNRLNDWFSTDISVCIRQDVLGRELTAIAHSYPANWWQAIKARWLPRWVLRPWPVKETTVTLTARELYPKIAMPEQEWAINLEKRLT
jgi:hypothetical protein